MGNKKKHFNDWDISIEDEMAQADLIYKLETGECSIDDLIGNYGKKKGKKNKKGDKFTKNGIPSNIEKLIVNNSNDKNYDDENEEWYTTIDNFFGIGSEDSDTSVSDVDWPSDDDDSTTSVSFNEEITSTVKSDENSQNSNIEEHDAIRSIGVYYDDLLGVGVMMDGICPYSFSLIPDDNEAIIDGQYDGEEAFNYAIDLFTYAEILRYPTALFKENEFIEKTKHLHDYDHTRYQFSAFNGWVFCYVLDGESINNFFDFMHNFNDDNRTLLRVCAHIASLAEFRCNCIHIEDEDLLNRFYISNNNQKDMFMDMLINDEYTDVKKAETDTGLKVIDVLSFSAQINAMLESIVTSNPTGDDDYDEEDDGLDEEFAELEKMAEEEGLLDEEKDEENDDHDDESVEGLDPADTPSTPIEDSVDNVDVESNVNDLVGDDMEFVEPDKKDSSMVIQPHHKPSVR